MRMDCIDGFSIMMCRLLVDVESSENSSTVDCDV